MTTSVSIDEYRAKEIAMAFLQQNYSIIRVKNAILEDGIWRVEVEVSSFGIHVKTVSINSETGAIIEYFSSGNS